MLWVGTEIALPILSNVESRRRSRDCQIDDASFIGGGLDGVRSPVLTEGNGAIVGIAGKLLGVKVEVLQRIGGPEVGGVTIGIEDLGIELACSVYTAGIVVSVRLSASGRGSAVLRDIAVDDLSHSNMATIRH